MSLANGRNGAEALAALVRPPRWISTHSRRKRIDPVSEDFSERVDTIWPLAFSPSAEPIVIKFEAGYDDLSDLPGNVKVAILLQLRHLYSLGEVNLTLRKDTVFGVGEQQF
jgi:hypothetical protein